MNHLHNSLKKKFAGLFYTPSPASPSPFPSLLCPLKTGANILEKMMMMKIAFQIVIKICTSFIHIRPAFFCSFLFFPFYRSSRRFFLLLLYFTRNCINSVGRINRVTIFLSFFFYLNFFLLLLLLSLKNLFIRVLNYLFNVSFCSWFFLL